MPHVMPLARRALLALGLSVCALLPAQQRIALDGIWQLRPEADADTGFEPVQVPAAFETVLGVEFDGVARYRRTLPLPETRTERVFVEFDAVATHARVFCNGKPVGEHLGGWSPFRCELTAHIDWQRRDENVLEVVVDEKVGHNTQGFLPIIQPHFGGIWQSVTLCCSDAPTIDRHDVFVHGDAQGAVTALCGVVGHGAGRVHADAVKVQVLHDGRVVAEQVQRFDGFAEPLTIPDVRTWSPTHPTLYTARLTLLSGERELDRVERRFGCRSLRADGMRVLWNDAPLQVRGVLHWGYSPPDLAPPHRPSHWRPQLEYFKSLGFNCVKCCLWVPPRGFYELCDELGLLVWQEYPTWHPTMDQAHKQELLTEYGEFFRLDRSHPSVGFRSITCETGQGADLDVVTALFEACKAAVPDTLVVDDSSWIGWQRITDFWDEHPYGNNSWFPGRLQHFRRHIAEHGAKPLLLGECLAADTWVPRADWLAEHGTQDVWWRPLCWDAQTDAERWLVAEFGSDTLASLQPIALRFGMRNRKFQIEQLRTTIPDAGYVVSVARDFAKARMGLYDDLDRQKWSADDWAWHGDTMLCLQTGVHGLASRAIGPGDDAGVVVRIAHFGAEKLRGRLRVWCEDVEGASVAEPVSVEAGAAPDDAAASVALKLPPFGQEHGPRRLRIHAELTGSHPAQNRWDVWWHPGADDVGDAAVDVITADRLTPELLDRLENGARVLLQANGDLPDAPRNEGIWVLKGAPFAPTHPAHDLVPRDLLLDTVGFDLESGRVIPWQPWRDQVDPILAFWDTHDIADVRFHLHAFDTRVGKGRLLVTALAHDDPDGHYELRRFVREGFVRHLAEGPAAKRSLSDATIAALRAHLNAKTIELPTWRFRMDPDDVGRDGTWFAEDLDTSRDAGWRDLQAGSHWENQGDDLKHFTGIGWYRIDIDVPADWQGLPARLVFDGVDDSFDLWLNGEHLGTFGDEATRTTIWLEQQVQELAAKLRCGGSNTVVLRVVDHAGAGGMWKPARLTTGPVGDASRLLR